MRSDYPTQQPAFQGSEDWATTYIVRGHLIFRRNASHWMLPRRVVVESWLATTAFDYVDMWAGRLLAQTISHATGSACKCREVDVKWMKCEIKW